MAAKVLSPGNGDRFAIRAGRRPNERLEAAGGRGRAGEGAEIGRKAPGGRPD